MRIDIPLVTLLVISGCAWKTKDAAMLEAPSRDSGAYETSQEAVRAKNTGDDVRNLEYAKQISVAAIENSKKPHTNTVSGRCVIDSGVTGLDVPCVNVEVVLVDASNGAKVSNLLVRNGTFSFGTDKKKSYRLEIKGDNHILVEGPKANLKSNDVVVLKVKKKN